MTNSCNCPNGSYGQKHSAECLSAEIERLRAKLVSVRARCLNLAQWLDKGCDPKHGATEASFIALFAKEPSDEPNPHYVPDCITTEIPAPDDEPIPHLNQRVPNCQCQGCVRLAVKTMSACAYIGAPQGEPKPCILPAGHSGPHAHAEKSGELRPPVKLEDYGPVVDEVASVSPSALERAFSENAPIVEAALRKIGDHHE